jgi:gamma-glutamyltranspeptidase
MDESTVTALRKLGHVVAVHDQLRQGDAHSIGRDASTGRIEGVADRRVDGWCAAPVAAPNRKR